MEVMVGSPFGIGMAACIRDRTGVSVQDKAVPKATLFLTDDLGRGGSQIGLRMNRKWPEESSDDDSSSSIGENSENEEDDDEEDDAVSFQGTLCSFGSSLEDSLPIKRGLSNHYVGKSKSFGNLMESSNNNNAKDLEKGDDPFNKRRRLLIANKLRSRGRSMSVSNFYSWQNPNSMPLLAVQEHNEVKHHNGDDNEENEGDDQTLKLLERTNNKRDLMAQSRSCFCLSSLQEEEDDDEGGVVDDE